MERSWNLSGAYAAWTMTLSASPVADEDEEFVDDWAPGPLDRIGGQFLDLVNLLECQRLLDERSRRGSICT